MLDSVIFPFVTDSVRKEWGWLYFPFVRIWRIIGWTLAIDIWVERFISCMHLWYILYHWSSHWEKLVIWRTNTRMTSHCLDIDKTDLTAIKLKLQSHGASITTKSRPQVGLQPNSNAKRGHSQDLFSNPWRTL